MIAFEVRRNGQLLCTAGHADMAVLHGIVHYIASKNHELLVSVSGLTEGAQGPKEHVEWLDFLPISLGDEVSIKIVDVQTCDSPTDVRPAKT